MKPILNTILFFGLLSCLFSCRPAYLGAGLHGNEMTYWSKPTTRDSAKITAVYASGNLTANSGYQAGDRLLLTQGAVYQSHTSKGANLSYGVFGYAGNYNVGTSRIPLDKYQGNYGLYGGGLRASFNFNANIFDNIDWRFIGIDMAYSREFGSLSNLRRSIPDSLVRKDNIQPNYDRDRIILLRSPEMFTWGFTSEIVFKGKNNERLALKYFLGRSEQNYQSIYANNIWHLGNLTLAYQNDKVMISAQMAQLFSRPTINMGFGYRLGSERVR